MVANRDLGLSRLCALVAAAVVAAAGMLVDVAPAAAAPVSTTYTFLPQEQTFTVPSGVTTIHVVAIGGRGFSFAGGHGARVEGDLTVTPGQLLYIEVGGNATSTTPGFNGGAPGGSNPSLQNNGRPGGGATDIRTCSMFSGGCPGGVSSLSTRILVAGGGGGEGGATLIGNTILCLVLVPVLPGRIFSIGATMGFVRHCGDRAGGAAGGAARDGAGDDRDVSGV